jgi:hypothetical protein
LRIPIGLQPENDLLEGQHGISKRGLNRACATPVRTTTLPAGSGSDLHAPSRAGTTFDRRF